VEPRASPASWRNRGADDSVSLDDFAPGGNLRALPRVAGSVELWWCALDRTPEDDELLAALLAPREHERAARFGTEALRRRWIAGRASLRLVLGRTMDIAPAAVPIRRGRRGRPELADPGLAIDFNVSHTQGTALIGLVRNAAAGTRIGVDVERADRDVGADRLARKFLTATEQETLAGMAESERRARFLRHWTCKEAMSKATGDGLAAPFRALDVTVVPTLALRGGPAPYLPRHWELHAAPVPPGWLATIAIWHGDPAPHS
jgi:4'-phosphopantetheinyl transferase